jgi:hypothetical protein
MTLKALKPLSKEEPVSAVAESTPTAENTGIDTSTHPLTTDQLLAIIVSLQTENAKANAALANAILETTKPREVLKTAKQLADEANDKMFYEQSKELSLRQKDTKRREQELCDHIAGSRGDTPDMTGKTSIVWHRTDAQVDIGICQNCGRMFHPEDPLDEQNRDYTYWRRKKSFNKISAAGVRQFMNPLKAQHDSFLRDS